MATSFRFCNRPQTSLATLVSAVFLALPLQAADLSSVPFFEPNAFGQCAVSAVNGKMEAAAGFVDQRIDDGGRGHVQGTITSPLNCDFGLQIDAGIGDMAGSTAGGIAAHLFNRDPNSHLIGLFGQWSGVGSQDVYRVGVETEFYRDRVSVEALGGFEDSDRTSGDIFAILDVAYYKTDNLRLTAGYRHVLNVDAAAIGLEWMPEQQIIDKPVSLFAKAAVGSKDYATLFGGVRIYFGDADKSLIRRHREDDPQTKGLFEAMVEADRKRSGAAAAAAAGGGAGNVGNASDARLKRDIVLVGELSSGLPLYSFRYLWSDDIHVGVMAQDVLKIRPDAVITSDTGYLAVRYDMLGTRMYTYSEWTMFGRLDTLLLAEARQHAVGSLPTNKM